MATPLEEDKPPLQSQQILVRADEVDSGTAIPSEGTRKPLSALSPADVAYTTTSRPKPPPRPALRRDGSALPPPPPPVAPPPAPPVNVTDSLSLPQLKQLVNQFPKSEQRAYAYVYRDAEDYATEVDEWFQYTELEQDRDSLLASREAFEQRWKLFGQSELNQDEPSWTEVETDKQRIFISQLSSELQLTDGHKRQEALATLYYILTGVWSVTAGLDLVVDAEGDDEEAKPERHNMLQLEWMKNGAELLADCGVIHAIHSCLFKALDEFAEDPRVHPEPSADYAADTEQNREITLSLSCLYLLAEAARVMGKSEIGQSIRAALMSSQPNMLVHLVGAIARLRWDESFRIPSIHAVQLLWKLILVFFGDTKTYLEKVKSILQPRIDPFSSEAAHPVLTASPLDYHLFRQEITSKYPAYNPPPPLIPLEIEQKSMLPPPLQTSKLEALDNFAGSSSATSGGGSILYQPVHIATPAPSPPPSPAIGGKAGKKQNYQTNQNFPFLYPPLDSASNNIGGKGTTEYQDRMVGKQWEGSDIPASIIEAGELFASRMRMTRGMRQLWTERDLFMKFERGWDGTRHFSAKKVNALDRESGSGQQQNDALPDEDLQERMNAVEDFFHQALPDLQSLVIVMMKIMLSNVQDVALRNGGGQDNQINGLNRTKSNPNMTQSQSLPLPPAPPRPLEMTLDDLDNVRSREISQKAISGAIFLLLKWFKISHVLKFEYLTQLLLDSNYVQLTLKYFAHQNLEDLVAFKYDRDDLSYWHYCHRHSDHPPLSPTSPESLPHSDADSADDAIPPPIQRHRRSPTIHAESGSNPNMITMAHLHLTQSPEQTLDQQPPLHPTVDELGNPLAPLPTTPITTFSSRQLQTSIHLLRILQKVTRSKSHRILLLVQFKSSQILRRVLRVPDTILRLYVLKLFKSQVPYCGRKWRQSNMRVITAIYLHCRPELRDEWLAGMHDTNVEGEVDEAVPLEWALRGLTFWWMKRTYPDKVQQKNVKGIRSVPSSYTDKRNRDILELEKGLDLTAADTEINIDTDIDIDLEFESNDNDDNTYRGGQDLDDDERDFFQRELDAMGWGMATLSVASGGDDVGFGTEAPGDVVNNNINSNNNNNNSINSGQVNGVNGGGDHHVTWGDSVSITATGGGAAGAAGSSGFGAGARHDTTAGGGLGAAAGQMGQAGPETGSMSGMEMW